MVIEFNGKKYLEVDIVVFDSNVDRVSNLIKRCEAIHYKYKKHKMSLFFRTYVVASVLVPEQHIETWRIEEANN